MVMLPDDHGLWYVTTPYSNYPGGKEEAYDCAMDATQHLLNWGLKAFSPIVHCHEMAKKYSLPTDYQFWAEWNHKMILGARGIIIVKMMGWYESKGVRGESDFASANKRPILTTPYPVNTDFIYNQLRGLK